MKRTTAALSSVAAAGLVVAAISAGMLVAPSGATAATSASSWGAGGLLSSNSAVTVRWDNTGNAASNVVPRDATQVIPHTAAKTYADVGATIRDEYAKYFGTGNGMGGLSITISQTAALINQAVQVTATGAVGGRDSGDGTGSLFQVMQCWGAMKADGTPDAAAPQPDPATCQIGPGGADVSGFQDKWTGRVLRGDPLTAGGDWDQKDKGGFTLPAPFSAITGATYRGSDFADATVTTGNPFFNHTTTNELTALRADSSGTARGLFELQTGQQSEALGCGLRAGGPSVAACWLVIVPRPETTSPASLTALTFGPLAPSLWAQRLQVKLEFQKTATSCPGGTARTLSSGSELLTAAMSSWIPGICDAKKIGAGYTQLGDAQARQQLSSSGGLIFTTRSGVGDSTKLYAPVALTAPVIAFTIDAGSAAKQPGQIRDLKLNARLVAKLLTQSYRLGMDDLAGTELKTTAPWYLKQVRSLAEDPEFVKLNPGAVLQNNNAAGGDLLVENLLSDAGAQVWQWLLDDPDAASFLTGCPDAAGMVINPFFSARSYTGCAASKSVLDAAAQAKITQTRTPADFIYGAMVYPPDGVSYPQPGWYRRSPVNISGVTAPPLTWNDIHGRVSDLATAGRAAFQANYPSSTVFCLTSSNPECIPTPGVWKSTGRQQVGNRIIMTITDAAAAARFQLPTAQLCDDSGTRCVGANQSSLTAAAVGFEQSGVAGVAKPAARPDYAGGAYPLTMPVYAAIGIDGLAKSDATAYSSVLSYLVTSGQKPGFESGLLPPGYAPLTPAMVAQTATVVKTLADFQVPVSAETSIPESVLPADVVPQSFTPPLLPAPVASTPASQIKPEVMAQTGTTGRTEIGFPQFGLLGGLGAALASGLMAPILTRRRKALDQ